jgi:hypothetical protein
MLRWSYSNARLSATMSMKNEFRGTAIAYATEESTNAYFEFVLREIHNARCGGDPETSPAIDRYRVYRRSGKIEQWEAAEDKWQPYKPAQTN